MARGRKVETGVKRDNKGRILPKGISQRKDGRYIWRYTYNGVTFKPVYSWDLQELKRYAEEERVKIAKGCHIEPSNITLNEYFYYCQETYKKDKLKERSYKNNNDYWGWYVRDYIGKKRLQSIKPDDLIRHYHWLQNREDKPISYSTTVRVNSMINEVFERAVKRDLLMKNPAYKVLEDVSPIKMGKKKIALTEEQQARFMEFVSCHRFYKYHKNLFTYLFGTGCRVGEACALCFQDINFDDNYITIYKTLYFFKGDENVKGEKRIGSTKTENSTRTPPMLSDVRTALMEQMELQKAAKQKCCESVKSVHDVKDVVPLEDHYNNFVFLNNNDTPYTPDYVTGIIKKIIKSYNKAENINAEKENRKPILMPDFSSHNTRHTFATRCKELKLPKDNISRWLGHKTEGNNTTDIYIHTENWKDIKDDVETLNKMIIK